MGQHTVSRPPFAINSPQFTFWSWQQQGGAASEYINVTFITNGKWTDAMAAATDSSFTTATPDEMKWVTTVDM